MSIEQWIDNEVKGNDVVLFMKGTPQFPQCGFSARALHILQQHGDVHTVDVLADPEVRQGIKEYSNWPTIPQVFINGKFVGGSDILMELEERGELADMVAGKTPA